MTRQAVHELLEELHRVILEERHHARELNLAAMAEDTRKKEGLLQVLASVQHLPEEDRELARRIKRENLRNAYLFKATLNWIQDTMEFFGRKTVPTTYCQYGTTVNTAANGRLLSGHI